MTSTAPWHKAHEAANDAKQDGYIDPDSGLFVMTRHYLVTRGTCCSNDCRHCPFGDSSTTSY